MVSTQYSIGDRIMGIQGLRLLLIISIYRISRGNYSFLDLTLCTVTFDLSTYRCGNYSRAETIRGNRSYQKMSKRKVVFNLMFIKKIL